MWYGAVKSRLSRVMWKYFPNVALKRRYRRHFGEKPNLKNPQTFNEKMLVRLIRNRDPKLTLYADKVRVREFVRARLHDDRHLTTLYAVVRSPELIDHLALPRQFVMKPNHLSGDIHFVRHFERGDTGKLKDIARGWLKQNYGYEWGEWAYVNIPPQIMFEELLDVHGAIPDDFKFLCFDGEPKFIQVDRDRFSHHKRNYYDHTFHQLPLKVTFENISSPIEKPSNLGEMLDIARKLASGEDFLRVDLYNVNGRIVFGELTNYPAAGLDKFEPPAWNAVWGAAWRLRGMPAQHRNGRRFLGQGKTASRKQLPA